MKLLLYLPLPVLSFMFMLDSAAGANALEHIEDGIVRGQKEKKEIALVFTGGSFAEGGTMILDVLKKHGAKAAFFFTGDFMRTPEFKPLIQRIVAEGHYLGPHSDKHLLYAPWEDRSKSLVTDYELKKDLEDNIREIEKFGVKREQIKFYIPPFEWYNKQHVRWAKEIGLTLINFTPGTRSTADYTGEKDKNFVPSNVIFDSIIKKEKEDPHGLNGFLLLLHVGAGPGRTDKFFNRFGELMDYLASKGYKFPRVDAMLAPALSAEASK
jgi:peptidoglycan/xylan/chitin deacetylase (PgdA/CDA1 family)